MEERAGYGSHGQKKTIVKPDGNIPLISIVGYKVVRKESQPHRWPPAPKPLRRPIRKKRIEE